MEPYCELFSFLFATMSLQTATAAGELGHRRVVFWPGHLSAHVGGDVTLVDLLQLEHCRHMEVART